MLHQAALAACGVVLVNDALLRSFVKRADSHKRSLLCSIRIRTGNGDAGAGNKSAGGASIYTIADTAFLVLLVAFDCRLNISQLNFLRTITWSVRGSRVVHCSRWPKDYTSPSLICIGGAC